MKDACKILVIILGVFIFNISKAQIGTVPKVVIFENLKLGFYTGVGTLVQEFGQNKNHDFQDAFGNIYSIEFSKLINDRVEVGFAGTQSYFNGTAQEPLSSWMSYSEEGFDLAPIMYNSQVQSFKVIVQYNFQRFYTPKYGYIPVNLFIKMGFGMGFIQSELRYIDTEMRKIIDPIYEIGRGDNEILGNSSLFSGEIGFEYHLSDRLSFRIQGGVSFINKDFVDGIYNRTDIRDSPNTYTMMGNAIGGIVYYFNYTTKRQLYSKQYPWFEKKFKNLYSKFYRPKSKKVQVLKYPWHKRKQNKRKQNKK